MKKSRFLEDVAYQAASWDKPRRVITRQANFAVAEESKPEFDSPPNVGPTDARPLSIGWLADVTVRVVHIIRPNREIFEIFQNRFFTRLG